VSGREDDVGREEGAAAEVADGVLEGAGVGVAARGGLGAADDAGGEEVGLRGDGWGVGEGEDVEWLLLLLFLLLLLLLCFFLFFSKLRLQITLLDSHLIAFANV